ncbi:MAG: hypothetical protein JRI50_01195 [Deltaproteobacteria bacterium]|nr:hypothetical protein [Deltaproteobacteria bacterium]MBW2133845.1 hypothetical protein [Deltaproteobacteria bacterium]
MNCRNFLSWTWGGLGAATLAVSIWGLARGLEPFASWFYSFAWWSYILLVDCLIYQLQGRSLLVNRFPEFLALLPASITCWLIFEAFNLSLGNWHYLGLPSAWWLRWPSYLIAYATVFPALFQTAAVLEAVGLFRQVQGRPRPIGQGWYTTFVLVGAFCLVWPLILPRYGFPLVWLGFIFLLEPFCHLGGGKSLVGLWAQGERRELLLLLSAGLICGFLWELWNYWAISKWVYTLPFFNWGRVFEMPILGYLGFPPFAVECAVMYNFIQLLRTKVWQTRQARWLWGLSQVGFWIIMLWAIDKWTVICFRG